MQRFDNQHAITRYIVTALAAVLLSPASPAATCGADAPRPLRPGRLPTEVRKALVPGWQITFTTGQGESRRSDARRQRLAAILVPAGQPPTPFLPGGLFEARLRGFLKLKLKGEYEFSLRGTGAATLSANGVEVLSARGEFDPNQTAKVALNKGYNLIEIAYEPPPAGDARLRLYWSSEEFPPEPLPTSSLFIDPRGEELQAASTRREGRLLLAQRNCLACHAPPASLTATGADKMPELARDAPRLTGAGSRLRQDWLAAWIADPTALHNKTTMPAALAHLPAEGRAAEAADLAAYVASLKSGDTATGPAGGGQAAPEGEKLIEKGEILFEDRGCIACHRFTPPGEDDDYDRVSLHFVGAKFHAGALKSFLLDPRANYQWSRMPHPRLQPNEAAALAAHLRKSATGAAPASKATGDPTRGKILFSQRGCGNCHAAEADKPQPSLKAGDLFAGKPGGGCLAEKPPAGSKAIQPNLTVPQRAAVKAFLSSTGESLARTVPQEFSRRQVASLNCKACHRRDGEDADLPYLLQDEGVQGRVPENVPDLSWVGEKLHQPWLAQLLTGKLPYRTREHFRLHMPGFPARGELLARGLLAEHAMRPAAADDREPFKPELAKIGKDLAAMTGGLACHRCHAIGDKKPVAPFEAHSTNLAYAAQRLRSEYYHRWMRDPLRVDAMTKMPKFAPDGKKTGLTGFYDGDARKQFTALWHYLEHLRRMHSKPAKEP